MKYAATALANNGTIEIKPKGYEGYFTVNKIIYKTKSSILIFRMSSGLNHKVGKNNRDEITKFRDKLSERGIDHKVRFTSKRKLIHDVKVIFNTDNIFIHKSITNVILLACSSIGLTNDIEYELTCYGPFNYGYVPEDGDAIEHRQSYLIGFKIGRLLRRILPR